MTHCTPRFKLALLIPVIATLGGCADTLVYGESTNFSLASVKVNTNVAQPFSVNFALDRTVAAMVPPMGPGEEAANMISRFKLDDTGNVIFGTKKITTEFASGRAAEVMVTTNVVQALNILDAAEYANDKYSACITRWINEDPAQREARIATMDAWWADTGYPGDTVHMRQTTKYAAERKQFAASQNLTCK